MVGVTRPQHVILLTMDNYSFHKELPPIISMAIDYNSLILSVSEAFKYYALEKETHTKLLERGQYNFLLPP